MINIGLLIFATFIWGLGFVGSRWTFQDYDPIWSNTIRFALAAILGLPFVISKAKLLPVKGVLLSSFTLAVALITQTIGVANTSMAKSGFLTVLYAFFTPLFCMLLFSQKIKRNFWALLSLALVGIALLCEFQLTNLNSGDFWIILSAIFFSAQILVVDRYAKDVPAMAFNLAQCVVVAIFSLIVALIYSPIPSLAPLLDISALTRASSLWGFIIVAILSSILAFGIQIVVQKKIKPHVVSLIFLLESVFATILGFYIFNETLNMMNIIGCACVLAAVGLIPLTIRPEKEAGLTPTH